MKWLCRLSVLSLVGTLIAGTAPASDTLAAEEPTPAAFVSNQWRVIVQQTAVADEFSDLELTVREGKQWVIVVADVTNLAGDGTLATDEFGVRTDSGETHKHFTKNPTVAVSKKLGLDAVDDDGTVAISENGAERIALAFIVPTDEEIDVGDLELGLAEQSVSLTSTVVETIAVDGLPSLNDSMDLQIGYVQDVSGGGQVNVTLESGEALSADLISTTTPPADGCYGAESAQAVLDISGGTVWLEEQESGDGYLAWANDTERGSFVLLNQRLIEEGAAGYDSDQSAYDSWLANAEAEAKENEAGLWALCRDVAGTYINPPTPTAEEVRAGYQEIDVRDLVIRPDSFIGEKIVVSGEVFVIQVEGTLTAMQIFVTTVDGSREAVAVGYEGDTTGIYEGTSVTVYGVGAGKIEGTNAFGGYVVQPLIRADIVDY